MKKIYIPLIIISSVLLLSSVIPAALKPAPAENNLTPSPTALSAVSPDISPVIETAPPSAPADSGGEYNVIKWSYEEYAQHSTNIVLAKYIETVDIEYAEGYPITEYVFSVAKQIKGSIDEEKIFVRIASQGTASYASAETFLSGSEQMLLLSKRTSVYQPHDYYLLNGNRETEGIDIDSYAKELTAVDLSSPGDGKPDFTRSDNMDDVISVSENIFEVEIKDVYIKGRYAPTTTYTCLVKDVIQGFASSSEILITFFNDTVEIGKSYIVLLPYEDADCTLYSLSSPENSVYTPEEAAQISQISSIMESRSGGNIPPAPKTDAEILAGEQEYYFGKVS